MKEAESLPANYPQRSAVAARHLQSAIEAYRRIAGTETRREELHRILLTYQSQSVSDLKTVSSQIDLSELVQQAVDEVTGKSFPDAILSLAFIASSPRKELLRQLTEERSKKYGLWYWIPVTELDSQGRTTARRPGLPDDPEAAIRAEMFREATHQQNVIARGIVRPSVSQINLEHYYQEHDFLPFLWNNPFIPPRREIIYARGLCAGLRGDMAVAIHLLIPQLENSLRYVLQNHGHITSGLDDDQIQDEFTLQKLLYTFKEQLEDILGEDILFDLQGLLIERFGSNLRNLMAHGLLAAAQFATAHALYLWWLTLRMCCLPIYIRSGSEPHAGTDESLAVE